MTVALAVLAALALTGGAAWIGTRIAHGADVVRRAPSVLSNTPEESTRHDRTA